MKVAIIGSGNMATGIGTRIAAGGYDLIIYDREEEKATALAAKLGGKATGRALTKEIDAEIVILALPYMAIAEIVEAFKEQLGNKILVDISNPVDFQTFELLPPKGTSGVEEIAKLLPPNAKIVKAFNTTFAGTLTSGEISGKKLDVFVAGDSDEVRKTMVKLINDCGLRGIDAGELKNARYLEAMMLLQMKLQATLGTNWMSAIKILP